jgi:S-adenosylmethionine decarboxylase
MIHIVYDITGCHDSHNCGEQLMTAMRKTAEALGCTVRAQLIEPFQPHGATCVLILAESHIVVSTWPEDRLAHVDIFTCRAAVNPGQALQPIVAALGGQIALAQEIPRISPGALSIPGNTGSKDGARRCLDC